MKWNTANSVYHISIKGNAGQSSAFSNSPSNFAGWAKDKFIKESFDDEVHTGSGICRQRHDHLKGFLLNK